MRMDSSMAALWLGIVVALALLVSVFFPFGLVGALLLVLPAAMLLCYWRPGSWVVTSLLLAVPPFAMMAWMASGLDRAALEQGIGVGLLAQLALIPVAALAGGYAGRWLAVRKLQPER